MMSPCLFTGLNRVYKKSYQSIGYFKEERNISGNMKQYNLIGCCGISCGLCPRFQSKSKSRCLGCGPDAHCSYCSIFRCCVTKRALETCGHCLEFPCGKYEKWFDADSFVTHQKCLQNIQEIKTDGIEKVLKEQEERKRFLEIILENYNPGRCSSLYCLASALMGIESLKKAENQIESVKEDKAKSFKKLIQKIAEVDNITLNLRK